jgi:hypothetical protein
MDHASIKIIGGDNTEVEVPRSKALQLWSPMNVLFVVSGGKLIILISDLDHASNRKNMC